MTKWNVDPKNPTTILRLISELEGSSYLLEEIDQEDYDIIKEMIGKYYKLYFKMKRDGM